MRVYRETRALLLGKRHRLPSEEESDSTHCGRSVYLSTDSHASFTDSSVRGIVRRHRRPSEGTFQPETIAHSEAFRIQHPTPEGSIAVYVAELRKLAEYCEYGATLSDMLRDRLVCGILDRTVQRRLLQQHDLTFDKALEIALTSETAEKDSEPLNLSTAPDQIGKVKDRPPPAPPSTYKSDHNSKRGKPPNRGGKRQQSAQSQRKEECYRCGGDHSQAHCPYKEYDCNYCKKKGHLARRCRKRTQEERGGTNKVTDEETLSDDQPYRMHHVNSGSTAPLHAVVIVNGSPLSMEIDTGASVSIASRETFNSIQEGESTLELAEPTVKLQTYTGEPIRVCGTTQVQVKHKEQTATLPLVITEGNGPTLLGRNWLEALRLDWRTIFHIGTNLTLQKVLNRHPDAFKEELGELRGVTAKIHVNQMLGLDSRKFVPYRSPYVTKWNKSWTDFKRSESSDQSSFQIGLRRLYPS